MNEKPVVVLRPETLALDALIRSVITNIEASEDEGPPDRMVFLGNRHQSFPTAVIEDRVLEPVDKVVWMVISLAIRETRGDTAFPGYEAIGRMANVASRSTIARAIAILRASRWLTLCGRVRRASGKFHGNIYALHDEPLPLVDALHLNTDYMTFLGRTTGHGHARVRAVAQGVLDSIDEDIKAGADVCRQEHPIARRLESTVATQEGYPRRFFAFTPRVVRRLYTHTKHGERRVAHHDQNSNTVGNPVQNLSAQISNSSSSSNYINTTTTPQEPSNFVLSGEVGQPLVYPSRLSNNHRAIAMRYLRELAPQKRQSVLDELEGRFRAEAKGMNPVYDEISFLQSLCKGVKKGTFLPNLGIRVRDGRCTRQKTDSPPAPKRSSRPPAETDEARQRRKAAGKAEITKMRNVLGMRAVTENQEVTEES